MVTTQGWSLINGVLLAIGGGAGAARGAVDVQDGPVVGPGKPQQAPIGVDHKGVAHHREHGHIGKGVGVGVALRQVVAVRARVLDDEARLLRAGHHRAQDLARGPVGLDGLTSEKYVVLGDGHIRK